MFIYIFYIITAKKVKFAESFILFWFLFVRSHACDDGHDHGGVDGGCGRCQSQIHRLNKIIGKSRKYQINRLNKNIIKSHKYQIKRLNKNIIKSCKYQIIALCIRSIFWRKTSEEKENKMLNVDLAVFNVFGDVIWILVFVLFHFVQIIS